jgi:hypothetical protein
MISKQLRFRYDIGGITIKGGCEPRVIPGVWRPEIWALINVEATMAPPRQGCQNCSINEAGLRKLFHIF